MGQNGGPSVAHLTLDGELRLDINLSNHSPDYKRSNTGEKENGGEDDDGNELRQHTQTHSEDGVEIVRNRAINCDRR